MKIIIAGIGKIGTLLVKQLSAAEYDITIIDLKQNILEDMVGRYDIMAVQGNCASMSVLLQAEVEKADLLIAMTERDEVNLLSCMTAHGVNPRLNTIAKIRNPEYSDQVYKMRDTFALSLVVNPDRQAAREVERLLKFPGFLKRDTFAKGRVEIVELLVEKNSKLDNLALNDLYKIIKGKVLVSAVARNGENITPDGNFILRGGDHIFVTATMKELTIMLKNLGIIAHKVKRIIICGGGRMSFYLAQQLERSGITVQIIEQNYDRCVELANLLPGAYIVHGDASSTTFLESEGIADCDALITATGLDEMNMVIALYGNNYKIPQVITKISHLEQTEIINSLQLGSIISPKQLCCNNIVRYVRAMNNQTGQAEAVHSVIENKVEAIEFRVDEKTLHCKEPLKSIALKPNILISCIIHGMETKIPDGNSYFQIGDTVIIVSSVKNTIYQLNDIFA
ncbi:MAG: Trk system potassium transporter TrkA [Lachnospiraceae bacterium]